MAYQHDRDMFTRIAGPIKVFASNCVLCIATTYPNQILALLHGWSHPQAPEFLGVKF